MGRASSHFFDANNAERQTLLRRIIPSDDQFQDQQTRWNSLADFLMPKLHEASGYPMRSWLQGSYKFGTQVRPVHKGGEFDIDLGLYFCWEGPPDLGDYGPRLLKQMVQSALEDFAAENDDVIEVSDPPKPRCCRIRFKGDFHIDVPCYHLDVERDARALATEMDTWEFSDPKALYNWFKGLFDDATRTRVRRLIRYMKAWAALKFANDQDRPSSVLLTVLAATAVSDRNGNLPDSEDEALQVVLRDIRSLIDGGQEILNPVDRNENLASRLSSISWNAFVSKLEQFADTATEAIDAEDEVTACTLWSVPFEHLFPLPDADVIAESEGHLPALRTLPEVQVTAVAKNNHNLRYADVNEIGPIPKDCTITFRVTNAHRMPLGTQFHWIVRNEGGEAEDINDLGHKAGTGPEASEQSAYNGTHYMDCTAVAANQIIGVRRVRVRIRSATAPKRNPPKPAWVKLRGRR
jgi:hypothetical protein